MDKTMTKEDVLHTISCFMQSEMLEKKVKNLLKIARNKIKGFNDVELNQLIDIIESYVEVNSVLSNIENLPFDNFDENDDARYLPTQQNSLDSPNIEWIKRPTLMVYITNKSLMLNQSLSEYVKDCKELIDNAKKRDSYYDPDSELYSDDNIRLLIGTIKGTNKITLGLITGQCEYNNFMFSEKTNGCLEITPNSFKYLNEMTKGSLEGIYVCNIDKKLNTLVGEKIQTTIES